MYYVWIWDWKFTALHIPTLAVQIEDTLGRGGSQVVSVLAFYFDDPSSNPAEGNSFFAPFALCFIALLMLSIFWIFLIPEPFIRVRRWG